MKHAFYEGPTWGWKPGGSGWEETRKGAADRLRSYCRLADWKVIPLKPGVFWLATNNGRPRLLVMGPASAEDTP